MVSRVAPKSTFLGLLPALLALAGCGDKPEAPPSAKSSESGGAAAKSELKPEAETQFQTGAREFVLVISGEPETLDPGKSRGVNESKVIDELFEGLTEYPKGRGPMAPGAAERWDVSPDGKTYTFHLRKDGKWSNGDPVTAEDFRYSWLRVLDKNLASPYAEMLFYIKNGKRYLEGEVTDPAEVGVKVIDPHTLQVDLEYVAPYFLELAAFHTYRPVHKATVEAHGDRWTRPENIVSNGPYKLEEWVPNRHLKLGQNPHYAEKDKLGIEKVTILPIQENSTMVNLFEAGKLDWSGSLDLPAIDIKRLSRRKDYREDPYLGTYFYRLNVTRKPFDDPRVRRALAHAIDRDSIEKVIKGGLTATATFVPPLPGYTSAKGAAEFDPEKAKALLAEAGFPEGKGFPAFKLLYNTDQNHKKIAEMVQQMWQKNLGIKVDLTNEEWKVYLKSQTELQYDVSRSGWIGDFHDPMTFLDMWTTGNGNNNTGWSDTEFDRLIEQAKQEGDAAKRLDILQQAEAILLERGPVVPVYHYARAYLLNPAVKGFEPHQLDQHPIKYISKN